MQASAGISRGVVEKILLQGRFLPFFSGFCFSHVNPGAAVATRGEGDFHVLCAAQADRRGAFSLEELLIILLYEIYFGICSVRVVVDDDQAAGLCNNGQLPCL